MFAGIFAACNDDTDLSVTSLTYDNCGISSFSLQRDDSILTRLDSVYFAIDLVSAEIYNADSLPVGTRTDKLRVKVGTESASACNITYRIPGTERDTTINLIDSPNDSINFADGPVKVEIVSYNGQAKRTYNVRVNVHLTVPDTLCWDPAASRPIPTTLHAVKAQKTVLFNGKAHCFTSDGSSVCMAVIDDPFTLTSTTTPVTLPSGAKVDDIAATTDALYCLGPDGTLHRSTDAITWTPCDARMTHIYGGYGDRLLGALLADGVWRHVTYPTTTVTDIPAGCPVAGTSDLVEFTSKWNITPTAIMVGGTAADGTFVADTWGYDGSVWARLSNTPLPHPATGLSLFPYNTTRISPTNWRVTESSALIAIGGFTIRDSKTVANDTVYVSRDFGISWSKADNSLQPPAWLPRVAEARALVFDHTLHVTTPALPASRVTAPIEEWECPYIYLFGGSDINGLPLATVRRGVINRFTFNPVY